VDETIIWFVKTTRPINQNLKQFNRLFANIIYIETNFQKALDIVLHLW
jgi:hypothetical protein